MKARNSAATKLESDEISHVEPGDFAHHTSKVENANTLCLTGTKLAVALSLCTIQRVGD